MAQLQATFRRPTLIPFPADNPFSVAKVKLGRRLFFDRSLSRSGAMACASCHDPEQDWSDGRTLGVGWDGQALPRRTPGIWNTAWGDSFFWDGRATSLEAQAWGPLASPREMGLGIDQVLRRLRRSHDYRQLFSDAFGSPEPTAKRVAQALATFERALVSPETPFDRWIAGDSTAISASAQRGFRIFSTRGGCIKCHSGWNFTNGSFADTGLPSTDPGRSAIVDNPALRQAFKTPSLREIANHTAFMHDGSLHSLAAVIDHYDRGGAARPTASLFLQPLRLSENDKRDLVSFLRTLTARKDISRGDLRPSRSPFSREPLLSRSDSVIDNQEAP